MLNYPDTNKYPQLIQNAVKITENEKITYLISSHRHHYNTYTFKDGSFYAVDGGTDYLRRGYNFKDTKETYLIEDYSLKDDFPISEIRDKLLWGSRGKTGREPIKYLPIKDLELGHLRDIIYHTEKHPAMFSKIHLEVINYWIKEKEKNE